MRSFMRLSQRCWRVPENGLHAPLTHIVASDSEEEERLKKSVLCINFVQVPCLLLLFLSLLPVR